MTARILDGKAVALTVREGIAVRVQEFSAAHGYAPSLTAVLVGEDPASAVYVRNKQRACEKAGIDGRTIKLADNTTESQLHDTIQQLNADPNTHGILVQLPLPSGINAERILDSVSPLKDVDAFHPHNVGLLVQGRPQFLPCTPNGILALLAHADIPIAGQRAVILGRSDIVGKPLANMMVQRGADATVTVCHSRTRCLEDVTNEADILVAAIGSPKFVGRSMVRIGCTVIDVGINRTDEGLVGDVDFESVVDVAGAITPVPGGIGPMTVAMLLENTLRAAELCAQ